MNIVTFIQSYIYCNCIKLLKNIKSRIKGYECSCSTLKVFYLHTISSLKKHSYQCSLSLKSIFGTIPLTQIELNHQNTQKNFFFYKLLVCNGTQQIISFY